MPARLARRAQTDLDDIREYVYEQSGNEAVADRAAADIANRFPLLARWPLIGRSRDDLLPGLRSFPAGDYLIFYRVSGTDVLITRILHARRDLPRLFHR